MHPAVQLADSPKRPTRGDLLIVGVFLVWGLLEAFFVNPGYTLWGALAAVAATLGSLARNAGITSSARRCS